MKKWTQEDRNLVKELTKNGWTVGEISRELDMPEGTVKAFRKETAKQQDLELEQLRVRVDELEKLFRTLDPKLQWVDRKMRTEQKQRDQESQEDSKPRWQPGLKK